VRRRSRRSAHPDRSSDPADPFCLLDEVDAPLDEANIGRFNQVVRRWRRLAVRLITHNPPHMEAADTLRITMEQAGVSKVVSVRLRAAA